MFCSMFLFDLSITIKLTVYILFSSVKLSGIISSHLAAGKPTLVLDIEIVQVSSSLSKFYNVTLAVYIITESSISL